jgi:DNA-directed RNA polymerase subunit RPC12/RpoP
VAEIKKRGLQATEFEHKCLYCNTIFIYNIFKDLKPRYEDISDGWITCPVCGNRSLFSRDINKLRKGR